MCASTNLTFTFWNLYRENDWVCKTSMSQVVWFEIFFSLGQNCPYYRERSLKSIKFISLNKWDDSISIKLFKSFCYVFFLYFLLTIYNNFVHVWPLFISQYSFKFHPPYTYFTSCLYWFIQSLDKPFILLDLLLLRKN